MQLSLSDEQARELRQALDLHLKRMDAEIVHTDDRAYREDLERRYERLESVRRELALQGEEPSSYAPVTDFPAVH